jgi:hypothetical protein
MSEQPPALGPQPSTTVPHYAPPAYPGPMAASAARPTNQLAIVSLVAGIASFVILPVIGAIVAVITGHMARSQIKRTGEGGDGMAVAGMILGYAHLVLGVLVVLVFVIVFLGFLGLVATQHPTG